MISMDKIYIVTSEWSTYNGDREFAVIGAFFDLREAVECLERERDTIITESYHFNSLQEARDDDDIVIEEDTDRFYIMSESSLDKWDELRIHEKLVKQTETDISRQLQQKKEKYYHSFIKPGAKVWWNDPACESSDWFYVDSIDDDGYPWSDETEVWLKLRKNDKAPTNQVLMQELSITNK